MYNKLDRVITISQSIGGVSTNQKVFFDKNLPYQITIKAITVSYYWSVGGNTDQAFLNLVNRKGDTLLYNYPVIDLMDYSNINPPPWTNPPQDQFKIREFELNDVNLINSYFFIIDTTVPGYQLNLNFYY